MACSHGALRLSLPSSKHRMQILNELSQNQVPPAPIIAQLSQKHPQNRQQNAGLLQPKFSSTALYKSKSQVPTSGGSTPAHDEF